MLVWAGIPRLDQLSWDGSMDKHADELSEYATGRKKVSLLVGSSKSDKVH